MKQRITPKQIDRLSEKGKKAYLAYCAKKGLLSGKGSWSSTEVSNTYIVPINKMECIRYPLLSIGQMIEFLDKHIGVLILSADQPQKKAVEWRVVCAEDGNDTTPLLFDRKELCDALWQAVKEVLEK